MPTIRDLQSILNKYKFSKVEMIQLTRVKPRDNRSKAKTFAAQIEKQLSGFQENDVVLVALTIRHEPAP